LTTKFVYITQQIGNSHDQFGLSGRMIEEECKRSGIEFLQIDIRDSETFRLFTSQLENPDNIIQLNNWMYDYRSSFFHSSVSSNIDLLDCPAKCFANIGDHPFATFMIDRISRASPNVNYCLTDRMFHNSFSDISGFNPRVFSSISYPLPRVNINNLSSLSIRPIEILVPSNIGDLIQTISFSNKLKNYYPYLSEIFTVDPYIRLANHYSLVDCALTSRDGVSLKDLAVRDKELHREICIQCGISDHNARRAYRIRMLKLLSESCPELNFHVLGQKAEEIHSSNVNWLGFQPFSMVLRLIANSRVVLHFHPTYFKGHHERPFLAASLGTPTITPESSWITNEYNSWMFQFSTVQEFRECIYSLKYSLSDEFYREHIPNIFERYGTSAYISFLTK